MEKLVDPVYLETQSRALLEWLLAEVLVLSSLGQLAVIATAYLIEVSLSKLKSLSTLHRVSSNFNIFVTFESKC